MSKTLHNVGKHLWVYFVWIVVMCFLWTWIFGLITRVSEQEKVSVFIGSFSDSFEKYEELEQARPQYIKEIELNVYNIDGPYFADFLSVFGWKDADMLILAESKIAENTIVALYAPISFEYCDLLPALGLLEKDGVVYGLKVHDKSSHESLITCLNYGVDETEENYYLLFNNKSLHLGNLSSSSNSIEKNGAVVVAQRLLSL